MGIVNQLGKFLPNIAELSNPLQELLSNKSSYTWGTSQTDSLTKIKAELTSTPILAWYNHTSETKVVADVLEYGVGPVLLQKVENN